MGYQVVVVYVWIVLVDCYCIVVMVFVDFVEVVGYQCEGFVLVDWLLFVVDLV